MNKRLKSCLSRMLVALPALLGLCLLLSVASLISNRNLPGEEDFDTLGPVEKARLAEALHLKAALGDTAWDGWGSANIPVIIWNSSHEFLVNYDGEIPSGWSKVVGEALNGLPYYRRTADNPQNFAYQVGDRWTASMATKQATDRFLIRTFQDALPSPIRQIFPYRLLIQPSETQIGGVLHESFHAYQYQVAPERMLEAESIHKLGKEYQAATESHRPEWKNESTLLADALDAKTRAEKIELVRQFLEARQARRKNAHLQARLAEYERWLEWEEGTAKYLEVKILQLAGGTPEYQPVLEMNNDQDFKQYEKVDQRWSQEIFQLRHQLMVGETDFYMTGLAQAFLLDDLLPSWKGQHWEEGVFLEDLLRQAVAQN